MLDDLKNIIARFASKNSNCSQGEGVLRRILKGRPPKTKVISVVNQKGGCAKTTTAVNLCGWLASRGYRVLLIDLDPQAHASLGLGIDIDKPEGSIHNVLVEGAELERVIMPGGLSGFDVVPSNPTLSGAQLDVAGFLGRECILKFALKRLSLSIIYDYIIIDCSPSLNLVTINSLAASHYVLIPIQPHYYSLEGMKDLLNTIDVVKERLNADLEILGILITLFDSRMRVNHEMVRQIRDYFKDLVFKTVIHLNVKLSESPIYKKPIHLYAPESRGARDYYNLAGEVIALTDPKQRHRLRDALSPDPEGIMYA